MTRNVLIVGAGNIGSRHLQGLSALSPDVNIFIVDPSESSLELSRERWLQTTALHNVSFSQGLPDQVSNVDCAILSSSADIRASVTKEILSRIKVNAILFEKVLFQREQDYMTIASLLERHGIKAWVNCVRRIWPVYQEYHDKVQQGAQVHMAVAGSSWGLGCNSIHMIDCLSYLTSQTEYEITNIKLDDNIIPSKRNGFYEFTGQFSGRFKDGSTFKIASYAKEGIPYTLALKSQNHSIVVHEDSNHYEEFSEGEWVRKKLHIPFQSQLSGHVVQDILDKGQCALTAFSDSVELHLPFIRMLLSHYNNIKNETSEICPIT
jgi:predicted dehydrogenase